MNIFYLDHDVKSCVELHVDKHVVKMIVEYAQILSTAHRMTDGIEYIGKSKTGRNVRRYKMRKSKFRQGCLQSSTLSSPISSVGKFF